MSYAQDKAVELLEWYVRPGWEASGRKWNSDNRAEIAAIVEMLVAAAVIEVASRQTPTSN